MYIKGKCPEEVPWIIRRQEERAYYDKIFKDISSSCWGRNVFFEKHNDDVAVFFEKIGYVFSTSDFESFHLAPIEGMASGAIPLVLERDGVKTIFPEKYVFETEDLVVDFVLSTKNNCDKNARKEFVKRFYNKTHILTEYDNLFQGLRSGIKC